MDVYVRYILLVLIHGWCALVPMRNNSATTKDKYHLVDICGLDFQLEPGEHQLRLLACPQTHLSNATSFSDYGQAVVMFPHSNFEAGKQLILFVPAPKPSLCTVGSRGPMFLQ